MSVSNTNMFSFDVVNNVYIQVFDKTTNRVKKEVEIHNKATRKMVTGLLRFLCGHFCGTYKNDVSVYDSAKDYIPCYIGFGYGGTTPNNEPISDTVSQNNIISDENKIIRLNDDWTTTVDYASTKLVLEIPNARSIIRKETDTFSTGQKNSGDMDGIYFYCETPPNYITRKGSIFLTELGLFADKDSSKEDLLAYVKLGNYVDDEDVLKTNVLYVRPVDTIIVKWVITIAAVGADNTLQVLNSDGELENTLIVPEIQTIDIEEVVSDGNG